MYTVICMFDLDETLLTIERRLKLIHDDIPRKIAEYNPYLSLGETERCYALHSDKMKSIFTRIQQLGFHIGFITAGSIDQDNIREFVKKEYEIELNHNFLHYKQRQDKAIVLQEIAKMNQCHPEDIFLIDDNPNNISDAKEQGFSIIHVDTHIKSIIEGNPPGIYIKKLEMVLDNLENAKNNNEEKVPFIPKETRKFPRIIIGNEEMTIDEFRKRNIQAAHHEEGFFSKMRKSVKNHAPSIHVPKCLTTCFKRSS